jgi:hypothetical protein
VIATRGSAVRARIQAAVEMAELRTSELSEEQQRHTTEQRGYETLATENRDRAKTEGVDAARFKRDALTLRWRHSQTDREEQSRISAEHRTARDQWEAAVKLRDALQEEATAERHLRQQADLERAHAPLRLELVDAGSRLVGAILAERDRILTEAEHAGERATSADQIRQTAQQEAIAEAGEAARHRAEASSHRDADHRAGRDRADLVRAQVLEAGQAPADAQRALAEQLRTTQGEAATAHEAVEDAAARLAEVNERREAARSDLADAQQHAQAIAYEVKEADRAGRELAADARLLALMELEAVDHAVLDHDAGELVREAATKSVEDLLLLRENQAADKRAVAALSQTELMPPSPDVTRVLAAVGHAALGAYSGWAYLADTCTPPAARRVIETAPDVALGVVVRDADFEPAVRALQTAPPALDGAVRVVTQSHVAALVQDASGGDGAAAQLSQTFTVMPRSDAHFDRGAGRAELARREQRLQQLELELRAAERERAELEGLRARLTSYVDRFGPEWFRDRRASLVDAETSVTLAAEAEHVAIMAMGRAHSALEGARTALHTIRDRVNLIASRVQRIDEYIARHGVDLMHYTRLVEAAAAAARAADRRHEDALVRVETALTFAAQAREEKSGFEQGAAVLAAQAARVTYRSPDAEVTRVPGNRTLLQQEYDGREATYEGKVQAKDLRALAEAARANALKHRQALQKKLKWPEATIHEMISSLRSWEDVDRMQEESKTAADSAQGREGSLGSVAARHLAEAEQAVGEGERLGLMPVKIAEHARSLPADPEKTLWQTWLAESMKRRTSSDEASADANDAERLAGIAAESAQRVRADVAELTGALGHLRTAVDQSANFLATFAIEDAMIGAVERPGSDAAFRAAVPVFQKALKELRAEVEALDRRAADEVHEIHSVLGNPDYAHLREALFTRMREADPAVLEAHAEALDQSLAEREMHLIGAIADLNQHREQLVELVLLAAEEGRRLLRQVGSRSMIPTKVPNRLGGQQFLKVLGADPSPDAALDRRTAGALVDGWVGEKQIPKALDLIQGAVQALAPKLKMQILHPDGSRVPYMHSIEELGKWSGGEKLTASTLLYCTLARVRAVNRGETGDATGVLVCDNPQGTASRASFLLTQLEVARALGVQLIYFTGINDLEAVRIMPNVIKVKNDAIDRKTGQQVLSIGSLNDADVPTTPILQAVRLHRDETRYPVAPPQERLGLSNDADDTPGMLRDLPEVDEATPLKEPVDGGIVIVGRDAPILRQV